MRVPDWRAGGRGGALDDAFIPRRKYGRASYRRRAYASICTRLSIRRDRAVAVCLDYLRHLGVEWSPHPTEEEARREYERIWSQLGSRTIEELIELPLMSDPASLATLDVLTKIFPPALFTDANLLSMAVCRAVNLSLEQGNSDGSCVAYVFLGKIAGPHFGDYKAGFRFGQLGYELVEKRGLKRFQARTYHGLRNLSSCHGRNMSGPAVS